MRYQLSFIITLCLCLLLSVNINAAEPLGTGKNTCQDFIKVVDGNWSHPLNALHFHGYISWAQGAITGHNQNSNANAITVDADTIKFALIDYCRNKPDAAFANSVYNIIDTNGQ